MADLSKIKLPDNTIYDIRDANKSGCYTVIGTQTESTSAWTGSIPIPHLYTGLSIDYYLPCDSASSGVTLNLTLSDGATTGGTQCYINPDTVATSQCKAGQVIHMTYYSAGSISINGSTIASNRWIFDSFPECQDIIDGNVAILEATPGKVCSFSDAAEGVPLNDLQVSIEPKQASGTPWIDSTVLHKTPYLFTDVHSTASRIGNHIYDKIVGGTVAFNQLLQNGNFVDTSNWKNNGPSGGSSISVNNNIMTQSFSVTPSQNYQSGIQSLTNINYVKNHKYLVNFDFNPSINCNVRFYSAPTGYLTQKSVNANVWSNYARICLSSQTLKTNSSLSNISYATLLSEGDTLAWKNFYIIDLTQMFGSTIADYIYTLEQSTAGAGVAWFRKYFPKAYYAYNAGELMSVKTSAHVMTGFNQWDEEWELGALDVNGNPVSNNTRIRAKNYINVFPNTTYYAELGDVASTDFRLAFYDTDKTFISNGAWQMSGLFTTPDNARFVKFTKANATTYNHDICINLSWDGERNGEYEPYVKHEYPLDSSLELRGIPKLDSSNNLYYDGDEYESDGTVTRRYGIVNLGSLNWSYITSRNMFTASLDFKETINSFTIPNMVCYRYVATTLNAFLNNYPDMSCTFGATGTYANKVCFRNTTYTDATAFKTAMSGVYLVYELATPTTETAEPFTNPQIVDDFGTEEFVDNRDVAIPVGHETYQANISDIIGYDTVNIHNTNSNVAPLFSADSSFDGVVEFNQLVQTKTAQTLHINDLTITFDGNGKITVDGEASASTNIPITSNYPTYYAGHKYFIMGCPSGGSNSTYSLRYNSNGFGENGNGAILMAVTSGAASKNILVGSSYPVISISKGTSVNKTFEPILIDLTRMFGSTIANYIYSLEQATSGAGVALFRSIYPEDYYAYDTGTTEIVGSRNGDDYSISLGDTYYGCTIDVTTGVLIVDSVKTLLKDLPNQWIKLQSGTGAFYIVRSLLPYAIDYDNRYNTKSNVYSYSKSGTQPNYSMRISDALYIVDDRWADVTEWQDYIDNNDIYIVYPLAMPITIQLTPMQITPLLNNNIWADIGDIAECKYFKTGCEPIARLIEVYLRGGYIGGTLVVPGM